MIEIKTLSGDASQKLTVVNEDSLAIDLVFRFLPSQNIWLYNVIQEDFRANGLTLVVSPNTLLKFHNLILFGIACISTDGFDPYKIDDFSSGRISVFVLTQEEKNSVTEDIFNL